MKQDDINPMINLNGFSVLKSQVNEGFFVVKISGVDGGEAEHKVEARGANLYPKPHEAGTFAVAPIYPPVFYNGSLRYLSDRLTWFIDDDRLLYISDSLGSSAILKNGKWIENQSLDLFILISACVQFLDWLEAELHHAERGDALVQALIVINDDTSANFPRWLVEMPSFLKEWEAYKSNYKLLCAIGQEAN